jgi:hypothetical protein
LVFRGGIVAKTAKKKTSSKKTKAPAKKVSAARKPARPAAKTAAKYEQPGAPWWKRVSTPPRKAV